MLVSLAEREWMCKGELWLDGKEQGTAGGRQCILLPAEIASYETTKYLIRVGVARTCSKTVLAAVALAMIDCSAAGSATMSLPRQEAAKA